MPTYLGTYLPTFQSLSLRTNGTVPTEMYTARSCIVLHGFGAHPLASFQGRGESNIWIIRDWLPQEIPLLNVMSYGYGTRFDRPNATGDVREWAQALSYDLGAYRSQPHQRSCFLRCPGQTLTVWLISTYRQTIAKSL